MRTRTLPRGCKAAGTPAPHAELVWTEVRSVPPTERQLNVTERGGERHDMKRCRDRLKVRRDAALGALGRYGRHDPDCPKNVTGAARLRAALAGRARCVCGLDVALADGET